MKFSNAASPVPSLKVLLIDDNRQGLMARKSVLEEQGYEIAISTSGEDGIEQFANNKFDLVVTDYKMPRMNGAEVIARIQEARPGTPVILISGMVDALGLNEQNTGADVVLAKSSNEVSHLIRAVNRLLRAKAKTPRKPVRSQSGNTKAKRKTV
jgi:CheY-like chemotaxis protein